MKEKLKNLFKDKKKLSLLILVLILIVAGFFVWKNVSSEYENSIDISGLTKQEIQDAVNKNVKDGEINVQYSLNASFNGDKADNFLVRNIDANKGDILFTIYDENGNSVYESKKVKRGQEVRDITLDKSLSKGKHECSIQIGYVDAGNVTSAFPINVTVN